MPAVVDPDIAGLVGQISAVVAGVLLWVLAARLGIRQSLRAAVVALYAAAVLAIEITGSGVDGIGLLLLVTASTLAIGGGAPRSGAALAMAAAAVAVVPVSAVGLFALLGGMAYTGALGRRLGRRRRFAAAVGCFSAAAGLVVGLARPAETTAVPPSVPILLSVWGLLVVGILWRQLPGLRPAGVATLTVLGCAWLPGPDADAALLAAAVLAVLTALTAEESGAVLVRKALGVAAMLAVLASAALLTRSPAVPLAMPSTAAHQGLQVAGVERVRPLALSIPAIGVAGPLEDLVADRASGELSAPADPSRAGWYAAGVVPGDRGPAVIGGHVDSRRGPGVFFALRTLRRGDIVEVARSDGRTARFTVIAVARYAKGAFPTRAVYGPTAGPELRLVTCGGIFDRARRSYQDNIVIDAALI